MKRLLSIAATLTLVLTAMAQTMTYKEAQQLARENYPLIKRYDLISRTEQLNVSNIQKAWLPQVQLDAQATWQNRVMGWPDEMKAMLNQMGLDMKGLKKDQYKVGLTVQQQVYDGGATSARRTITKAQTKVDEAQTTTALYALRERVDDIYFSLLLTDERMKLNKEMQATLQANEDKLRKMAEQGTATQSDVNALHAELLTARQQHTQLETTHKALCDVLAVFTGRSVTEVVRPTEADATTGSTRRPELDAYDRQADLLDAQKVMLRSNLMPKLGVFANGYYGYPGYNMFEDMRSRDWSMNVMVGAKLSWNIGALYTRKNDYAKLDTQRSELDMQRETFVFNNRLQQTQESTVIQGYRRTIEQDDEILQLRQRVRKSAEAKLNHGIISINDLVQEITRENQAAINKSLHEVELLQHQYKLANAMGI